MRRFLAPVLPGEGALVTLDAEVSHHLLRVTGIAAGERVCLFDGEGQQALAELCEASEGRAVLRQLEPTQAQLRPERHLLIGVSKHAAMDTLMRMATELGATRIQPVLTARSVAKGDRGPRWVRICQGAAAQCGRADLPKVDPVQPLAHVLEATLDGVERFVLSPVATAPLAPCRDGVALLIGPEGGLTDAELELAQRHGYAARSLGSQVLRADTAVAAALARLT